MATGIVTKELLEQLSRTPGELRKIVSGVEPQEWTRRGANGNFALVEHVWHLADLEREGFGLRIDLLLTEEHPHLPNFDGEKTAIERRYLELSMEEGLKQFTSARNRNVEKLTSLTESNLGRTGMQEGVGPVTLRDLPDQIAAHDAGHLEQILDLLRYVAQKPSHS